MLLAQRWSTGPAALWGALASSLLPGRMQQSNAAQTRANLRGMQHHELLLLLLLAVQVGSGSSERVTIQVTSMRSWTGKIAAEPAPMGFSDAKKIAALVKEDTPVYTWPKKRGWTLPENNIFQSYMCRFGERDMACWDFVYLDLYDRFPKYPVPLFCPPGFCCAGNDVATVCHARCGIIDRWEFMDANRCSCGERSYMCGPNSYCDDSDRHDYGGVVCRCKKGFVGDGVTCHPDPCREGTNKCHPGECKARPNGHGYCVCPYGYFWNDSDPRKPACGIVDTCADNPCGPSEAVLECRTEKALEYLCVCRAGYRVGAVDGKTRCVKVEGTNKCEDEPCGTDGLLSCADTAEGPDCVCKAHYRLVKEKRKQACVYAPCDSDPCGDAIAVKACISGLLTYSCTCNEGYILDTVDGQPKCVKAVIDYTIFFIAGGCGLIGLLICLLSCFILRKRMLKRTSLEQYQYEGMEGMQGTYQDGIGSDADQWM